jgi:hypothetical protein
MNRTVQAVQGTTDEQRTGEIIGEVLGTAVFYDQLQQTEGQPLSYELFRLFFQPLMQAYYAEHQHELQPTAQEIEVVTAYFVRKHQETVGENQADIQTQLDAIAQKLARTDLPEDERTELEIQRDMLAGQLQPPGPQFVEWLLGSWKFQRHLYLNYGGGRILWQQAGLEAFDATYQWLTQQEQAGAFTITDEELRTAFYAYWTTLDHGAFLIDDQTRIEQEFLYPEWASEILHR